MGGRREKCCVDRFLDNLISKLSKRDLSYDLLVSITGGVIASIIVAIFTWNIFTSINPNKVSLCLRYAYEFQYEKATHEDPVREILATVPVIMDSGQRLRFAVTNRNLNSLENCTLHIEFGEGLDINAEEPWQVHLPDRNFTYIFGMPINNGLASGTTSLIINFKEKRQFKAAYTITAKGMKIRRGHFIVIKK